MKDYKNFYTLFILLSMSLGFTACSDDDDDVSTTELVGTWEATWEEGYEKWEGEYDEWADEPDDLVRITFNDNGTYYSQFYYGGKWQTEVKGTYSVKGNKLYAHYDEDGEQYDEVSTIVSLSSTELVVEEYEKDEYGEWYVKITFKRVK